MHIGTLTTLCSSAHAFTNIVTSKALPSSRETFRALRYASSSSSSSSNIVVHADESYIFDRKAERSLLKKYFAAEPSAITILLGPLASSCGKSSILRDCVKHRSSGSICYISFRDGDCSTPAGLAAKIERQGLPDLFTSLPDTMLTASAASNREQLTVQLLEGVRSLRAKRTSLSPLSQALGSLEAFLKGWEQVFTSENKMSYNSTNQRPVIIFDEASCLMSWSEK
jgi:hypothetical protein